MGRIRLYATQIQGPVMSPMINIKRPSLHWLCKE